ncbi:MAG: TonB-dependent receptor [Gemmatimonadaceae bacterium]
MRKHRWWFLVPLWPAVAGAQSAGAIAGRVSNAASGDPVAAEVTLDGVRRVRADERGAYRFDDVAPGRRMLRVRYPGFTPRELPADVKATAVTTIDAALDQAIVPLGAVVVTAARREQTLADAVVETELIGTTELKRSGASDVAAAITDRAGIQLDGGVPAGAGAQIRGFDSRRVLVLLDGQPMTGRLNGNFDLSRLPLGAVERIEVVKGPQSTLYGSDAIGGVINIITRRPPTQNAVTGALQSTVGSVGRREYSGEAGWRRGEWSAVASAGHRGIDLAPGVPGDAGTLARRWDGLTTLRWEPDSAHRFEAGALLVGEQQRYRTGQLFHFGDNTQLGSHLTAVTPLAGGRLTSTLSASLFRHLSRASTLGSPASDSGAKDHQTLAQGSLLYSRLAGAGVLDAGLDLRQEQIVADRVAAAVNHLRSVEPFAQYTTTLGGVQWSPGVRATSSDRWGLFVAPRIAALLRPRPTLALRMAAGRGFRAPDFKELYFDFVNASAGYASARELDLKPESSTSVSLGAEWDGSRLYLHTTAFVSTTELHRVSRAGCRGHVHVRQHRQGQTRGIETEAGIFVQRWRLDASGAWMHAQDNTTGCCCWPSRVDRSTHRGWSDSWRDNGVAHHCLDGSHVRSIARRPVERPSVRRSYRRGSRARSWAEWKRRQGHQPVRPAAGVAWPGFTGRQFFVGLAWRSTGAP